MTERRYIGARYLRVTRNEPRRYWHPERDCYINHEDLQPYLDAGWHACNAIDGYLWREMPTTLTLREGTPLVPSLPAEIWLQVISQLEYTDLAQVASTCQHFRYVGQWCMVQRQRCGLSSIREVNVEHVQSLLMFGERWPEYQSILDGMLPVSKCHAYLIRDLVLERECSEGELCEVYEEGNLELRQALWQISPQPCFLDSEMKIGKHPIKLLKRVLRVLVTFEDGAHISLKDRDLTRLHASAKELYQSCYYYFKHHHGIDVDHFDAGHYRNVLDTINDKYRSR